MTRTVLGTIKKLQSLVNHPFLVRSATQKIESGFDDDETRAMFQEVDALDTGLRSAQRPVHEELSGKLLLLQRMLAGISASGSGDRAAASGELQGSTPPAQDPKSLTLGGGSPHQRVAGSSPRETAQPCRRLVWASLVPSALLGAWARGPLRS